MDEAQTILQVLYATRAHTNADRKKIDRVWADFQVARSRGQRVRFGELVVRRGILTAVELRSLLSGEHRLLGSDAAVRAASGAGVAPPWQQSANMRAAIALVGIATLVSAALFVNVGQKPALDPSQSAQADPVAAEAHRVAELNERLEAAAHARVAGNVIDARIELDKAATLALTKDESDRIESERSRLPANNTTLSDQEDDGGAPAAIAQATELENAQKLDEAESLLRKWINTHVDDDLPQEKDIRAQLARIRAKIKANAARTTPTAPEVRVDPAPSSSDDPNAPPASPSPGGRRNRKRPTPAPSAPPPEPDPEPSAPALTPDERDAADAAAAELVKLAEFCSKNQAYREARLELEDALVISPGDTAARSELAGLGDPSSEPTRFFRDNFARERRNAETRASYKLADLAQSLGKAGEKEKHDRWVEVIQQCFTGEVTEKALTRIGLAYFAPYLQWFDKEDAAKLEAGGDQIDGNWLDRDGVAEANAQHATWDNPWLLSDEAHELRTNLTYRNARRMLSQAGAFRRFFLKMFSNQWKFKQPTTKLPIILTKTRDDYLAQIAAEGERHGVHLSEPPQAAAFYQPLRPVGVIFVTIEPKTLDGSSMKSSYDYLLEVLKHELTHQIAREYSAFDCLNPNVPEQFWCIEGLAECMAFYENDRGHWQLTHPGRVPSREAGVYFVSSWGYVERNLEVLPHFDQFFLYDRTRFYQNGSSCYPQGASAVDFMLHGEHGRYRRSFVKLCELVHKGKITPTTFDECFPGVDPQRLYRQWLRFVRSTTLDDE